MKRGQLALEPRDVQLIQSLRPFFGNFGRRLIDTIVGLSVQSDGDSEVQILSTDRFLEQLGETAQEAFTLFLILVLILLSTGAWPWAEH